MLSFDRVHKQFGPVQALDDCSFSVEPGRMLGFLGPNGAGKTTAMRTIFGLAEPDGGTVLWNGLPIGRAERLHFGYMPEERGLYPRMSVGEQLAYFGALHGLEDREARTAAAGWLQPLDLAGRSATVLTEALGTSSSEIRPTALSESAPALGRRVASSVAPWLRMPR